MPRLIFALVISLISLGFAYVRNKPSSDDNEPAWKREPKDSSEPKVD